MVFICLTSLAYRYIQIVKMTSMDLINFGSLINICRTLYNIRIRELFLSKQNKIFCGPMNTK